MRDEAGKNWNDNLSSEILSLHLNLCSELINSSPTHTCLDQLINVRSNIDHVSMKSEIKSMTKTYLENPVSHYCGDHYSHTKYSD